MSLPANVTQASWLDHVTSALFRDVTSAGNRWRTDETTWRNGLTFQAKRASGATYGNQTHRSIYRRKRGRGTGLARDDTSNLLDGVTRIMKMHRCGRCACALSITWPAAAAAAQVALDDGGEYGWIEEHCSRTIRNRRSLLTELLYPTINCTTGQNFTWVIYCTVYIRI